MRCPRCHHQETKVIDSREFDEGSAIRRRRECLKCQSRFSTYEELELLNLNVVKKDDSREPYQRTKIEKGIRIACEKRNVDEERLKRIIIRIEERIQDEAKGDEISSKRIGELVMQELRKVDKVAYIRFASVYREFEDVKTFQEELKKVVPKKRKK
ncbi:transcriptional regulator NrdR [Patescibacteria group bacterium]